MDDYEALWRDRPMYGMRAPRDFLPLFAHLPMKASPGTTLVYDSAGYLPTEDGGWRTSAYSVPIVGGPDGGAYTTTADLAARWDALLGGRLLRHVTLERMLTPYWRTGPGDGEGHDGCGIWIAQCGGPSHRSSSAPNTHQRDDAQLRVVRDRATPCTPGGAAGAAYASVSALLCG